MRTTILTFLLPSISAIQFASFYEPQFISTDANDTSSSLESPRFQQNELLKRDGNCPVSFNSCSTLAAKYGGACCTVGSHCSIDSGSHVACCPTGALCTGSITVATATTSGGGGVIVGGAGATTTPTPTTTTSTTPTITGTGGIVPNAFFPFPIVQSSYVNAAACSQAYTGCQSNYAACTQNLQGGGFAVTVIAPQGGVTVAPTAQNLGPASATSICSSLSQAACGNFRDTDCSQFGVGTATGGGSFIIGGTSAGRAPRQTMGCIARLGVVAGLGMGVVGQIV